MTTDVATLQLVLAYVREIANDFLRRLARNYRNGDGQHNLCICQHARTTVRSSTML
jgi:hypothetical protein